MRYQDAIDRLLTLADFERKSRAHEPPDFHLQRMELLLAKLGEPHLAVPVIHVAGSKGKGSVCALIASALSANGLHTGLYTSPHLHRFTERIRVDGLPMDENDFAALIEKLWPEVEAIEAKRKVGVVSVFEMLTAMAFVHFREVAADCAVIEVGLGGRLDATNLVKPEVSVITPVSLDHVAVLGNTIAKIAAEKAGIVKPGTPVASAPQRPDGERVLRNKAEDLKAPFLYAPDAVRLLASNHSGTAPQSLRFSGKRGEYRVRLPLLGEHQIENVRTAITALEALGKGFKELDLRTSRISAGLSAVSWPARTEVIQQRAPTILVDGAHNEDSGQALMHAIRRHFGDHKDVVLILGGTKGHDQTAVARQLSSLNPRVVVTRSRHPKAIRPNEFADVLKRDNVPVQAVSLDTASALETARSMCGPKTLLVAAGSLFVAAEIREIVLKIDPETYPDLKGPLTRTYDSSANVSSKIGPG